jgi:hypothetical protein
MTTSYGRHAYVLCDAPTELSRCREFVLPTNCSDPVAKADVLVHQVTARQEAVALGWHDGGVDGPHYCPKHKDDRPL